jgi:hypothetical protein
MGLLSSLFSAKPTFSLQEERQPISMKSPAQRHVFTNFYSVSAQKATSALLAGFWYFFAGGEMEYVGLQHGHMPGGRGSRGQNWVDGKTDHTPLFY